MKRIGYFISEVKIKRMDFVSRIKECMRSDEFEIIKIDLNSDLEKQGPFDLIIHKLTDIHVQATSGDQHSQMLFHKFQTYLSSHPEIIVLNTSSAIANIIDRNRQYQLIANSDAAGPGSLLFMPTFVEITHTDIEETRKKLSDANVRYPIICKPAAAQGTSFCHEMSLIFCDEGLKDLKPPCVVQTFINHGGTLFKSFFIGDYFQLVQRPSLKNLEAGNYPTIFFNSHHISKPDSNHFLIADDEDQESMIHAHMSETSELTRIMRSLRKIFKLDLFGVDIIIEQDTGRYGVVDVNVFPGYEGVPMFMEKLVEHMDTLLHKRDQAAHATGAKNPSATFEDASSNKKPRIQPLPPRQCSPPETTENGVVHSVSTVDRSHEGKQSLRTFPADMARPLTLPSDSRKQNLPIYSKFEQIEQPGIFRQCHDDMVNVLQ